MMHVVATSLARVDCTVLAKNVVVVDTVAAAAAVAADVERGRSHHLDGGSDRTRPREMNGEGNCVFEWTLFW